MAGKCLVVQMRELPARVFGEELALDRVCPGKDIGKQSRGPQENHASVLMNQDVPVRNEELELAEEPEAHGQQDGDRCEYSVGDHRCVSFARLRWLQGFSLGLSGPGSGGEAGKQRRPSRSAPGLSKKKVDGTGCRRRRDEGLCERKELTRGGWAEDARRSPATCDLITVLI